MAAVCSSSSPARHLLSQVTGIGDVAVMAQADPEGDVGDEGLGLLHVRGRPSRRVPGPTAQGKKDQQPSTSRSTREPLPSPTSMT